MMCLCSFNVVDKECHEMHHGVAVHVPSGVSSSISNALALTKPLGTVLLKSTVSTKDPTAPKWSEIANDVVVNEKRLIGSRCACVCACASTESCSM